MRVTFINPPNKPFTEKSLLIEPIDTLNVASYTENLGHQVSVLDMDVKQLNPYDIIKNFHDHKPEVIVIVFDYHIPLHTTQCFENVLEIAEIAHLNGIKVIVGGKLASYLPEQLLTSENVDILISHDLELPLKALLSLEKWEAEHLNKVEGIAYKAENHIIKTKAPTSKIDLNELPIANRNLVDLNDYIDVRTILSSRGCFMKCSFCHVPGFWGNWRSQKPELVVAEIESLVNKYGAKKILFLDDNTTVDQLRMRNISQLIIEKGLKVKLGCLGTIVSFNANTMQEMYQAGFRWIHYGVESGDDRILKKIKKLTNRQQIQNTISKTKDLGFRVRTSWIMDLPGMDEEALENTINLILSLQTEEIRLHFLSIRLGSEIYDKYGKENLTQQYIHNFQPNVNISNIPADYFKVKIDELLQKLQAFNYTIIHNAENFKNLEIIRKKNPSMKIVSLCPLRYGINW